MVGTVASDFAFSPKVWSDHVTAYFDKKLVYGAFAARVNTLETAPGLTIDFPFYKAIGAAEEPAETDDLTVDNIGDDSFLATVKEVGKAVSITDKAKKKHAKDPDALYAETQSQIARVIAEKVDADLITEINTNGNYIVGFTGAAADATGMCTVSNLFTAKTLGFGDKADQTAVIFMHSLHYLSMVKDTTTGMMKADAQDPMYNVPGFMGRLFGAAVVVVDSVPAGPTVATKKSFYAYMCKANAYGFITKEDVMFEKDRDILGRKDVITATQWYAVKGFHAKIATNDYRITRGLFVTEVAA